MRHDVRKSAACKVCVLPVVGESGRRHGRVEVLGDGAILVRRPREVLAGAAREAVPRDLGRHGDGAADGGKVRAGGGEDGVQLDGFVVGGEEAGADAEIAGGLEDGDAVETELVD